VDSLAERSGCQLDLGQPHPRPLRDEPRDPPGGSSFVPLRVDGVEQDEVERIAQPDRAEFARSGFGDLSVPGLDRAAEASVRVST